MRAKNMVTIALLAFVGASVGYLIVQEFPSKSAVESESGHPGNSSPTTVAEPTLTQAATEPVAGAEESTKTAGESAGDANETFRITEERTEPRDKLVAYYFHRTQRCRTCLTIEAYAEEALRDGFADAFESGELEWQAVNVEEPQNERFVEEYGLTASALVMIFLENGEQTQWKNLERVWELVGDEPGFKEYVRDEALAYLESGS